MGKTTMIKLLKNSLDFDFYKKYGQTVIFPVEFNTDSTIADTIQDPGNTMCVPISVCDIASDQQGQLYDYKDLYSRVPSTNEGTEPRTVMSEAIKNGLKVLGINAVEKKWRSYWRADTGGMDSFDNLRSCLQLINEDKKEGDRKSPILVATPWYWEWMNEEVLSEGKNTSNYHAYEIEGWTMKNNEPHLIIEAWIGRKQYMSRAVCNKVMSTWGSQAWVLATDEIVGKRDKNILQIIVDLLTNFIISFKKQMPMPQEEKTVVDTVTLLNGSQSIYEIAKSLLKKRLTLDPSVPINTGCAQALSYVLKECGYPVPKGGISGTATMYEWLTRHFDKVEAGQPGDIIINVTGTGISTRRGHCAVMGKYQIMSNNSITGKWDTAWELPNWIRFYEEQGKMKTHYFRARE